MNIRTFLLDRSVGCGGEIEWKKIKGGIKRICYDKKKRRIIDIEHINKMKSKEMHLKSLWIANKLRNQHNNPL